MITSRCLYSWKASVQVQTGLGPQAAERGQSFPQGEGLVGWPRMGAPQEREHRGHSYGSKSCSETCEPGKGWKEAAQVTAAATSTLWFPGGQPAAAVTGGCGRKGCLEKGQAVCSILGAPKVRLEKSFPPLVYGHQRDCVGHGKKILESLHLFKILIILNFHIYFYFMIYIIYIRRRQWHPTPVLLLGKSHGQRSLLGCNPWDHEESDTTE